MTMKNYTFRELVDVGNLQELMERFYAATGIPVGIIDVAGDILVATGWQDICTAFHRVHPATLERCRQSDAFIQSNLHISGYVAYKCRNGLWDLALPLVIDEKHLATLFLGQFFYADEVPDEAFFRRQAQEFGFDEERYLTALQAVPVFTRERVKAIMDYYASFVRFIMETGLTNLKRMESEQARRESDELYRTMFEQSADGMTILDPVTMRLVDFNTAAHSRLGYTREEFAELKLSDIIEGFSPEQFAACESLLRERGAATFEFRDRTKTGETRDVLVSVNKLLLNGKPVSLGVVKDVTDLKRMQDELVKAQKLESLGILAGGIAHDFNNLLTGILGNLSIVRMQHSWDDTTRERLDNCESAVHQATGLTRQLLTFARGGDPVIRSIDTRRIIRESVSFALRGSNVAGDVELPEGLWTLEADEGQIVQVINNLLINADQAMPDGGTVRVAAANCRVAEDEIPSLVPGDYVRITVADQGAGIPPEHRDRIFDPFFTTKESGTGLGLTSIYSIVRKHGGQVLVASAAGGGARFDVYLPASREGVHCEETVSEGPVPVGGEGSIVVMDDEPLIRDVAVEMLSMLGYEARTCADGEALLELYRAAIDEGCRPDAIIMDLTIPGGMGGLEAASRILAIDPAAKLIVSSGYSNDAVMANHREYGFLAAVSKPFRLTDLEDALGQIAGRRE
jgi:PAS domain S-box-containing protein